MKSAQDIVITGIGLVSPIGMNAGSFYESIHESRCGVHELYPGSLSQEYSWMIGGEVRDFHPEDFIKPRKRIKIICHDIQMSVASAVLAMRDAGLAGSSAEAMQRAIFRPAPERIGIFCGADLIAADLHELQPAFQRCLDECWTDMNFQNVNLHWFHLLQDWGHKAIPEIFPLWGLKYLSNMHGSHIAIMQDAQGPSNTVILGECSAAVSLGEAVAVLRQNHADLMLAGSAGNYLHLNSMLPLRVMPLAAGRPAELACRPFDQSRNGMVVGEGAGLFVLERRGSAEKRQAKIQATLLSVANCFESRTQGRAMTGKGIRTAIQRVLEDAHVRPDEIAHVNASALGLVEDDRVIAEAIRDTLGDVWVTAPVGYFGVAGAELGAMKLAVSLFALQHHEVPPTLNCEELDPACPVRITTRPVSEDRPYAISIDHSRVGNVTAILLRRED